MICKKIMRIAAFFAAFIIVLSVFTVIPQTGFAQNTVQAEQVNYSWPMFHHDAEFTGYTQSPAPNTANQLWNQTLSSGVMCASPAIVDDRLFIQSEDNYVYCLNATTGDVIWKFRGGGSMFFTQGQYHPNRASPAIVNGKVYVGSIDDFMYCLNASSGDVIWKYQTGDDLYSFVVVTEGRVFTGSADFNLYCLDANTGELIWKYNTGDWPFNPAVAYGKVFAGSHDVFYTLDANTGSVLWNYSASSSISDSPAIADGKVFFADGGSPQGYVGSQIHCLDAETGTIIWSADAPPAIFSSPAAAYGKVFVGSWDKNIYCLNPSDGAILWNYVTGGPIASSPAIADGKLYIGSNDGNIYCLNATSGSGIWQYRIGKEVKSSPAIANGKLYIVSREGTVYCFGASEAAPNNLDSLPLNYELFMIIATVIIALVFVVTYLYVRTRKKKS